jgi:hypothetical protein
MSFSSMELFLALTIEFHSGRYEQGDMIIILQCIYCSSS